MALQYLRNHWEALIAYVEHGRLPNDNNQVERQMKRIAIGRKNWLLIGSLRAAIRNPSLMSLVARANRQDLYVAAYLGRVRLPRNVKMSNRAMTELAKYCEKATSGSWDDAARSVSILF